MAIAGLEVAETQDVGPVALIDSHSAATRAFVENAGAEDGAAGGIAYSA